MTQVWHPWTEWECYAAGMYDAEVDIEHDRGVRMYAAFLRNLSRFRRAMRRVIREWPKSCEHFLTNPNINRVAWLGQASMCIATGIPRKYRGGFNVMTADERNAANEAAQGVLDNWINEHERKDRRVRADMAQQRLFD